MYLLALITVLGDSGQIVIVRWLCRRHAIDFTYGYLFAIGLQEPNLSEV